MHGEIINLNGRVSGQALGVPGLIQSGSSIPEGALQLWSMNCDTWSTAGAAGIPQ
jgi:hypothetical protein